MAVKVAAGARKAFKYKLPGKLPDMPLNREKTGKVVEELTGRVKSQTATDIEERLARALDKYPQTKEYEFQASYNGPRNIPGELRPDFIVYLSGSTAQPLQPDGGYAHHSAEQRESDRLKDALLDEILRGTGALPTIRIPGDLLDTQEHADTWVKEELL